MLRFVCSSLGYLHRRGFLFDVATGKLLPGFALWFVGFQNLIIKVASVGKLWLMPFFVVPTCVS